jgi:hypothetical protein
MYKKAVIIFILLFMCGQVFASDGPLGNITINYSFNHANNYRLALNIEPLASVYYPSRRHSYEIAPTTFSIISDYYTHKNYLSMNALLTVGMIYTLRKNEKIFFALLLTQCVPNVKYNFNIIVDRLYLLAGQNTDYYLFYKKSVIHTESLVGFKYKTKYYHNLFLESKIIVYADCRVPWTRGYLADRKPYFNVGIGLGY